MVDADLGGLGGLTGAGGGVVGGGDGEGVVFAGDGGGVDGSEGGWGLGERRRAERKVHARAGSSPSSSFSLLSDGRLSGRGARGVNCLKPWKSPGCIVITEAIVLVITRICSLEIQFILTD